MVDKLCSNFSCSSQAPLIKKSAAKMPSNWSCADPVLSLVKSKESLRKLALIYLSDNLKWGLVDKTLGFSKRQCCSLDI